MKIVIKFPLPLAAQMCRCWTSCLISLIDFQCLGTHCSFVDRRALFHSPFLSYNFFFYFLYSFPAILFLLNYALPRRALPIRLAVLGQMTKYADLAIAIVRFLRLVIFYGV